MTPASKPSLPRQKNSSALGRGSTRRKKFHHALLDLTRFDPDTGEDDPRLRVVLQLMKLAREKELPRFFQWVSGFTASDLPDNLLGLILLYALHADSDLDVEKDSNL